VVGLLLGCSNSVLLLCRLRSPYSDYDDDSLMDKTRCRRPIWYRFQAPVCNTVHELDVKNAIQECLWTTRLTFGPQVSHSQSRSTGRLIGTPPPPPPILSISLHFHVGNNMYSLLTGLYPFYDIDDVFEIQVSELLVLYSIIS
jgi:hypothetical protein